MKLFTYKEWPGCNSVGIREIAIGRMAFGRDILNLTLMPSDWASPAIGFILEFSQEVPVHVGLTLGVKSVMIQLFPVHDEPVMIER